MYKYREILNTISKHISEGTEFLPDLALEVANFQLSNNEVYRKFCMKFGISSFRKIEELIFLPVEFFKYTEVFTCGRKKGKFVSSGTTGNRSEVFFNEDSLGLYHRAALRAFPFRGKIYSLIPPYRLFPLSSLSYMLEIFSYEMEVEYLNQNYELDPQEIYPLLLDKKGILFLTSSQLFKLIWWMCEEGLRLDNEFIIIDTGGYKNLKAVVRNVKCEDLTPDEYRRQELHRIAAKYFPNSKFWTEYGMSELFSQFYAPSSGLYREHHFAKIFTRGRGLLKVFDFANLCTVSALLVPDIVDVKDGEFEVIGRATQEKRGCGYVFR